MKTSVIDVRGMLSALSADRVEKRIGKVPGVESVTVNGAAGNATVRYDDALLEIADIKAAVHQSEYQSAGESERKHEGAHKAARQRVVVPTPDAASASASTPVAAAPTAAPVAPAAVTAPAAPAVDGHDSHAAPQPAMPADVAHEMGHSGKDLPAMVRDMRNRFWICLIFTVPLFFYSPMGLFTPPAPPFDLDLNVWLFGFATLAIVYPSWSFFVSAWRAIRKVVVRSWTATTFRSGRRYVQTRRLRSMPLFCPSRARESLN